MQDINKDTKLKWKCQETEKLLKNTTKGLLQSWREVRILTPWFHQANGALIIQLVGLAVFEAFFIIYLFLGDKIAKTNEEQTNEQTDFNSALKQRKSYDIIFVINLDQCDINFMACIFDV